MKHVAQGDEFMVYLDNEDKLWGTGNLPGIGQALTPVEIMEDTAFADCSGCGIIILKNDGTVWCMGSLQDAEGNQIVGYDGKVQVLDHVRYVTAGRHAMAAIREDDTLWMWGDNKYGQCSGTQQGQTVIDSPVKIKDGVKAVWIDQLSYRDYEEYPLYDAVGEREYMDCSTYIQQTNGEMYACGEAVGTEEFVPVMVQEGNY